MIGAEHLLADDLLARLVDHAELVVGVGENESHLELVGEREVEIAHVIGRFLIAVADEELDHPDVGEALLLELAENRAGAIEQRFIEGIAGRADGGNGKRYDKKGKGGAKHEGEPRIVAGLSEAGRGLSTGYRDYFANIAMRGRASGRGKQIGFCVFPGR